jgi:hypothetical protein
MIAPSARMMSRAALPGKKLRKPRFLMTDNTSTRVRHTNATL